MIKRTIAFELFGYPHISQNLYVILDYVIKIARLDQVIITLASGDKGQGVDPHSLQGQRTRSNISTLNRSMVVYVSTYPIHRATVLRPITRGIRYWELLYFLNSKIGKELNQVVITIASEDRGQGFDPYSLQGRRSFSTFDRIESSLSTLGRGMAVYVSTSPVDRGRRYLDP
ncbi:hypothetical protein Tco_1001044 [Tanacetum coccineum]